MASAGGIGSINRSDLVTVESSFSGEKFQAGKVYFLNTQKLSKSSLLVRGHDPEDPQIETADGQRIMPDLRSHTIWDTIQNTIEDPDLTLYLLLDEAHRGMREQLRGTQSIVQRLINGSGAVPGIPVVLGISATVQRFNEAVQGMDGHSSMPNVVVDPKKVQDSGLLKDTINLDVPDEVGDFKTVLLRRGAEKLKDISEAWAEYAKDQGDPEPVKPLMVLQVPNSPDHNEIGAWLNIIFETYSDLPDDCVANVFGEHQTEDFGGRKVRYVPPERVQEFDWIRILVAKEAVSTGWDCPRAEVMVSFRAAQDRTHITQLLGRMVRAPLARRIPGNERLNAVDCLLPDFNKDSVTEVVSALMTGGDTGEALPGRRVLMNAQEMGPNATIPEAVWQKLLDLPSQVMPKRQARPVKRLTALAHELAADALLNDAGQIAHAEMHKVLDAAQKQYEEEIKTAREAVLTVEGKTLKTDVETQSMSLDDFVEAADYAVIEDAYKRASRGFSPDLARTYAEYLSAEAEEEDPEEALIDAHTIIAAMGLVPDILTDLEASAEKLSNQWLSDYRSGIRGLSDDRQDVYNQIHALSANPMDVDLVKPNSLMQPTTALDPDGTLAPLPQYRKHLLSDDAGLFPEDFSSSWETAVLTTELAQAETIGWYRNPEHASQSSLGIAYHDGVESKIMRPDFIFFAEQEDGSIAAEILEPHGDQLADTVPKMRGLADYAEKHPGVFRRIAMIAKVGEEFKAIDLSKAEARELVRRASSPAEVYKSELADIYSVE